MDTLLSVFRWLIAGLFPVGTVIGSYLVLRQARLELGGRHSPDQPCLQCGQARLGARASFAYTTISHRLRRQLKDDHSTAPETPILVEESHFICDPCAWRYVLHEALMQILLVLPYPVYVLFIHVLASQPGRGSNLLLEAFLILLAISGALAAWNLYRGLHAGETPLDEIRDRTAIQVRKKSLGKDLGYYTRSGFHNLDQ